MEASTCAGPDGAKQLLEWLKNDLEKNNLDEKNRNEILEQLKVLGRQPDNVRNLYDEAGVRILARYAFGDYAIPTSNEARRCIANAFLLFPHAQEAFLALDLAPKATDALKAQNNDEEFLVSRILFLLTYNKSFDLDSLVQDHALAESIVAHIVRHSTNMNRNQFSRQSQQGEVASLSETVKLLFNVTNAKPEYLDRFNAAIPNLLHILCVISSSSLLLEPPITLVLNALASLDFRSEVDINKFVMNKATEKLINILDQATETYRPEQLETQAIPLLTLLRSLNDVGDVDIKTEMIRSLLPKDSERDLPLGKSSTLASRLLKLTTSPGLVNLPEAISSLLFELSDKNAATYIKNIGYGYAAGYLMTHNIPVPENAQQAQAGRDQVPINPVTGQRLDKEGDISPINMTQEEKEREAERLFVLFERLKATGVVDVQNPVHQAAQEGRFKEVSDSDSDPE